MRWERVALVGLSIVVVILLGWIVNLWDQLQMAHESERQLYAQLAAEAERREELQQQLKKRQERHK
jgi:hypothetical protein